MVKNIVKEYEELTNGAVKEWNSPGYSCIKLKNLKTMRRYTSKTNIDQCSEMWCTWSANQIQYVFNNPMKQHWKALTQLIGYFKLDIGNGRILQYPKELRLVAFMDYDYANDENRKSIAGGVMTMGGWPMYVTSKMQATVSLSSTEAEYKDLRIIAQEVLFWAQVLGKLFRKEHKKPSIIYDHNLGAIYLTKNPQISQSTKHVDVRYHFIRVTYTSVHSCRISWI